MDIGGSGSESDSRIFATSPFGRQLLDGTLPIPRPSQLPNSETIVPYYIVGDAAFPLKPNLMRPFPGEDLLVEQGIFNYRLSRGRRVVENAFGIMARKWRIFHVPMNADLKLIDSIIKAACVLHNYLLSHRHPRCHDYNEQTNSVQDSPFQVSLLYNKYIFVEMMKL